MEAQDHAFQARRWMDFCAMLDDLAEENFTLVISASVAELKENTEEQKE